MTKGEARWRNGNRLLRGAGVGALAHEEVAAAGATGIALRPSQGPNADDHAIAQSSNRGRSSIGGARQAVRIAVHFQNAAVCGRGDRQSQIPDDLTGRVIGGE